MRERPAKPAFPRWGPWCPMVRMVLVMLWLLGGFLPDAVAGGPPGEYAAEQTARIATMTVVSKIYVQGEKTRVETGQGSQQVVTIMRKDKGFLWMLWPEMRAYMENPIQPPDPRYEPDPRAKEKRQAMGTELVNGYQTQKFRITAKNQDGQPIIYYQWVAKKLGGLVIRRRTDQGEVELRNVVIAPQAPDLFEVPEGFRKIAGGAPQPQGK